ncbi:MAG: trigger factor [Bacteroidales bacterium]|nr:trigger factor [Bacteroidales bacterium]
MNVKQTKIDDLNLKVSINIENADYAEAKKKKLNDYRRNAELKGFRKGMAPMSLIEKIHGQQALAEAINTVVTEQLNKFIDDSKLNVLGEPLPSENADKNNWDNEQDFTFDFDIALAPKVEFTVNTEDKVPYYVINVTEKAVKDYKANLLKQFGTLQKSDKVKDGDFLVVDFEQGATKIENTYVSLNSITDADAKATFVGHKAGDVMEVDVNKTFTNDADRAALLKVKKEQLAEMEPVWTMTIREVNTFVDAEPTQQVFDDIFGKDVVKTVEEFDVKIKERLAEEYSQESDYKFMNDARDYLLTKTDLQLPDSFMKRWLMEANEGKFTMEEIEKEYDGFAKDFRWQMIRNYIMREQKLKVTKEDVMKQAKSLASYQFAMYGMNNVPDDTLTKFAEKTLADEQQGRRIYEKVEDDLVLTYVKGAVTLEKKKISLEKMREMNK